MRPKEARVEALTFLLNYVRHRGLSIEPLLEGLPYPREHFENLTEWIDFSTLYELHRRTSRLFPNEPDVMREIGRSMFRLRAGGVSRVIAMMIRSPMNLYKLLPMLTRRNFTFVTIRVEQTGPQSVCVRGHIHDNYPPFDSYFETSRGVFEVLAESWGMLADVDMQISGRDCVYQIKWEKPHSRLQILVKGVRGLLHRERERIRELESLTTEMQANNRALRSLKLTLEEKVAKRTQELSRAQEELSAALARAKQLEQAKTEFFANVSYELRTPLTLILGPIEKLLLELLSEEELRDLKVVHRNARTLLRHVNDLLEIATLDAAKIELRYVETDLGELVRKTASYFDVLARDRKIHFSIETKSPLAVQLDIDKVERVLTNLMSNAFKSTPEGGRVQLLATATGDHACITVADSGPGVRPEDRDVIFERFRQLDGKASRSFGGTGLGLSIAKEFVELHHGRILVDDAAEGGARFTVELPLSAPAGSHLQTTLSRQESSAEDAVSELQVPGSVTGRGEGNQPLVLVVEDNPEMCQFLVEVLTPRFRTVTARNGREALASALAKPPDLVLTDLMMPEMSGVHLVKELRSRAQFDSVPIMLVTAKVDEKLRVELLNHGAQDYVIKPFYPEELLARVTNMVVAKCARDLLQQRRSSQSTDLEALAAEMAKHKRQLDIALESVGLARDEARRAAQLKRNFLALVSHELRTPLTVLQLQYERYRHQSDRVFLDKMGRTLARVAEPIASLLNYARIESGGLIAEIRPFALESLVAEVIAEQRYEAELKQLPLHFSLPELPKLKSDSRLVRLIVNSLLSNAIKFTNTGGVEVSLTFDGQAHRIQIKDSGRGMLPEDQAQLFAPFAPLESISHKHTRGLGLGLVVVRETAKALGAKVELQSEVGVGTSVTVVLPSSELTDTSSQRSSGLGAASPLPRPGTGPSLLR